MREMRDSGFNYLGEIPSSWPISRLKGYFKVSRATDRPDATVLSLYRDYGIVPKDSRSDNHNVTSLDTSKYKFVEVGDFVINKMKGWQGSMALSAYEGIVSPAYHVFKFTSPLLMPKYAHYLLRCRSYADEWHKLSTGLRVGQWDLHVEDFLNTRIPVPPLDGQRRIADFLDEKCAEIDYAISAAERSIEEYKAYRRSAVSGCIEKADGSKVRFKNIARVVPNLVSPEDYQDLTEIDPENIEKDTGRLINLRSVYEVGAISDKHHFAKGQILYSKIRPLLNKVTIAPCEGLCSADMYPIETSEDVNWLRYAMTSESFSRQVSLACARVKMPKINVAQLGLIYLNVPFNAEQRRIVDYLDEKCAQIDAVIATKRAIVADLKAYKQSLIYETVTGKREV